MYYENFIKLCEEKGIRPYSVSKATGITSSTMTHWKHGVYTPKIEKLQKIADFFQEPLSSIIGMDDVEGITTYIAEDEKLIIELYRNERDTGALHRYLAAYKSFVALEGSKWQKQSTPEEKTEDSEQD